MADQEKFLVKSDFYVCHEYRHRDTIDIDRFKGCPEIYPYSPWFFYVKEGIWNKFYKSSTHIQIALQANVSLL